MRKLIKIIIFSLLLQSILTNCIEKRKFVPLKTKPIQISKERVLVDTTINYDLNGISSEGAEAQVKYKKGIIEEGKLIVFGETGKAEILYIFHSDEIKVTEKMFSYKSNFSQINSISDINIVSEKEYFIDFDGIPKEITIKKRLDFFKEFRDNVPFILK